MMSNCTGPGCQVNPINPVVPPYPNQNDFTEIDNLPYYNRTEYMSNGPNIPNMNNMTGVSSVPGTTNVPTGAGAVSAINGNMASPGMPAGSLPSQEEVFQSAPLFSVPNNPLLPPGYQNVLDYGNLQYMNGFLRTQIGKYVRVQQLVGSSVIEDRYGYLVGVGINYILLQEISTGNILVLDFYNIKYIYLYYTKNDLPQNEIR